MVEFIDNFEDLKKREELIKQQNKLSISDYFQNNIGAYLDYYQTSRNKRKACLLIITPQQSIFALVGRNHEDTANIILNNIFNIEIQSDFDGDGDSYELTDVVNNIQLGNIYIRIWDTDLRTRKQPFFEKIFSKLPLFKKIFLKESCGIFIYVPKKYNQYQIDELRNTLEEINNYIKYFKEIDVFLSHYIDDNNPKIYSDEKDSKHKLSDFLDKNNGEANNYVDDITPNPCEKIIVKTCKNNPRKSVVPLYNISNPALRQSEKENIHTNSENNTINR